MLSLTLKTYQFIHSNAELDDAATLKSIGDIGIEVPSDDDGLDGTDSFDPFLKPNLGDFIEETFSKVSENSDVAVEGPLLPILPSLVQN